MVFPVFPAWVALLVFPPYHCDIMCKASKFGKQALVDKNRRVLFVVDLVDAFSILSPAEQPAFPSLGSLSSFRPHHYDVM